MADFYGKCNLKHNQQSGSCFLYSLMGTACSRRANEIIHFFKFVVNIEAGRAVVLSSNSNGDFTSTNMFSLWYIHIFTASVKV